VYPAFALYCLAGVQFDLDSFKQEISRLAMPHQAFSYSTLTLNLLDDAALAAAFAVSLRTTFMQVPHASSDPVGEYGLGFLSLGVMQDQTAESSIIIICLQKRRRQSSAATDDSQGYKCGTNA
jgi:hypothetical protein